MGSSSTSASLTCDDKILASELALTYHTVKHNLSFNSMDCTVKLKKIIYVDSENLNYSKNLNHAKVIWKNIGQYIMIFKLLNENFYFEIEMSIHSDSDLMDIDVIPMSECDDENDERIEATIE
ncbi:hypothetical protein HF086_003125 [Spodoptera exigua]|uniref:Uncharacterized protein n=1 Tax=Spodoptera exigua TaxID=7107 RepID=A0A922MXP2_SPOEX|nr:hypothetical protein HF086_003125 [Spodoptera exigua]